MRKFNLPPGTSEMAHLLELWSNRDKIEEYIESIANGLEEANERIEELNKKELDIDAKVATMTTLAEDIKKDKREQEDVLIRSRARIAEIGRLQDSMKMREEDVAHKEHELEVNITEFKAMKNDQEEYNRHLEQRKIDLDAREKGLQEWENRLSAAVKR